MRCEEKVPEGKLVCLEVFLEGGKAVRVLITGDFFLHPEERIEALEQALYGVPLSASEGEIAAKLQNALGGGILIGATCADLARIFKKAVEG